MPIDVKMSQLHPPEHSVEFHGTGMDDDTAAWQKAFDLMGENRGGRIFFDVAGRSLITDTIIIPRIPINNAIVFEGLGRRISTIKANLALAPGKPMFQWEDTSRPHPNGSGSLFHVQNFTCRDMTLRRVNEGPCLLHNPIDIPGRDSPSTLQYAEFRNLWLSAADTAGGEEFDDFALLDMPGCKNCRFENISITENPAADRPTKGIGVRVAGPRNQISGIVGLQKSSSPKRLLDCQGGNLHVSNSLVDGGHDDKADYYFHDCRSLVIERLFSEGHRSKNIVLLENCSNVLMSASSIAGPAGYDLDLMSVATTNDVLDEGRYLVVVALVGTDLHIRIFDGSGEKVVDKAENELISGEALTALKQLNPLPDESSLSPGDKREIIRNATLSADHILNSGLKLVNSRYCVISGTKVAARPSGIGHAIWFDKRSHHNMLLGTQIVQLWVNERDFANQIRDEGLHNKAARVDTITRVEDEASDIGPGGKGDLGSLYYMPC